VLVGASWQRCRTHFMRNVLARVPKVSAEIVAAAIRTIFAQPGREAVAEQLQGIAERLWRQFPAVEQMLLEAAPDITAFGRFPRVTGDGCGRRTVLGSRGIAGQTPKILAKRGSCRPCGPTRVRRGAGGVDAQVPATIETRST
jgi:hypothetical protein